MSAVVPQAPSPRLIAKLLLQAGRLLLKYNEATGAIHRVLTTTARALTSKPCHIVMSYEGVAIWMAEETPMLQPVGELRYNMAVLARVRKILAQVRCGELSLETAMARLYLVEAETPRHPPWLVVLLLGIAGAALAALLSADASGSGIVGVATGAGLLVRQELERRRFSLLMLPLAAALLGAVVGGVAVRLGWTETPGLVLIVPALMIVPGPHMINGLLDLIDNQLPMSLARLELATGLLLAGALGVIMGIELTLPDPTFAGEVHHPDHLSLPADMLLAGLVASGFAAYYNTTWRQLWMTAAGGMLGHGLRYLALEAGCRLDAATFLGGLAVGAVSAGLALVARTPVAVIAFAAAVTMVPGLSMYQALAGALKLARPAGDAVDPGVVAVTLGKGFEAGLVVGALTLGLILGTRLVLMAATRTER